LRQFEPSSDKIAWDNSPKEEVREIAAKGGRASHGGGGQQMDEDDNSTQFQSGGTQNTNPGNFANR